jgi:hypothetical protein
LSVIESSSRIRLRGPSGSVHYTTADGNESILSNFTYDSNFSNHFLFYFYTDRPANTQLPFSRKERSNLVATHLQCAHGKTRGIRVEARYRRARGRVYRIRRYASKARLSQRRIRSSRVLHDFGSHDVELHFASTGRFHSYDDRHRLRMAIFGTVIMSK